MSSRGSFFGIDRRIWTKLITVDMSQAVAYLVLACGSDSSNARTAWSTQAIQNYTGMGWERAKTAIAGLVRGGFIRYAEGHTQAKPRYELLPWKAPDLDSYDSALLGQVSRGEQPTGKTAHMRLVRLQGYGLLVMDKRGLYACPEVGEDHRIWLPNSIVTGTKNGEESPVRRLRGIGDIWALRLFVDLYTAQNLRDDGGIEPRSLRFGFERREIGEYGPYRVWGFKPAGPTLWWQGPLAAHCDRKKAKPEDDHPVWGTIWLLQSLGLMSYVPHLFENSTDSAEVIHAYGIDTVGEEIEQRIGMAADRAGRRMCLNLALDRASHDGFRHFCPVLRLLTDVQLVGVARLAYRPHTGRTAAWYTTLVESGEIWISRYEKLAEEAKKSNVSLQKA